MVRRSSLRFDSYAWQSLMRESYALNLTVFLRCRTLQPGRGVHVKRPSTNFWRPGSRRLSCSNHPTCGAQ